MERQIAAQQHKFYIVASQLHPLRQLAPRPSRLPSAGIQAIGKYQRLEFAFDCFASGVARHYVVRNNDIV